MLKFQKHAVVDVDNRVRVRVWYSLDNHVSGRPVVTLYEKDYGGMLSKIIPDASSNDSDYQSDYVMKDICRLFENHPLYTSARQVAESIRK